MDRSEVVKFCDLCKALFPFDFRATYEEVNEIFEGASYECAERAVDNVHKAQRFGRVPFILADIAKDAREYRGYGKWFYDAIVKSEGEETGGTNEGSNSIYQTEMVRVDSQRHKDH